MASGEASFRNMGPVLRHLRPSALVRIFVPSRDRYGRPLEWDALGKLAENALLAVAGGATTLAARGAYRNGGQAPVRERVLVVESYLPARLTLFQKRAIVRLLKRLMIEARQESIAIALDGRLHLIQCDQTSRGDDSASKGQG